MRTAEELTPSANMPLLGDVPRARGLRHQCRSIPSLCGPVRVVNDGQRLDQAFRLVGSYRMVQVPLSEVWAKYLADLASVREDCRCGSASTTDFSV